MGKNFEGISQFDTGWENIYSGLIAVDPDAYALTHKAPSGHHRRIMQLETGIVFVHAASKALANGMVFRAQDFAEDCRVAAIRPYKLRAADVDPDVSEKIYKRQYKATQDTMKAFVHFKLFDEIGRGEYKLSKNGKDYYEYLKSDNTGDLHFDPVEHSSHDSPCGGGTGWGHPQVTLHAPSK